MVQNYINQMKSKHQLFAVVATFVLTQDLLLSIPVTAVFWLLTVKKININIER
jgi:hypothetical protein